MSSAEPYYCAVAKTSTKGRCTTECIRFLHGGRHCGNERPAPSLSPCRPDSSGADWFVCPRGTTGCPICHDGMVPYCKGCVKGDCPYGHEPPCLSISVEEFCKLHPEQREHLMGGK